MASLFLLALRAQLDTELRIDGVLPPRFFPPELVVAEPLSVPVEKYSSASQCSGDRIFLSSFQDMGLGRLEILWWRVARGCGVDGLMTFGPDGDVLLLLALAV